jgi:hypothetical protein
VSFESAGDAPPWSDQPTVTILPVTLRWARRLQGRLRSANYRGKPACQAGHAEATQAFGQRVDQHRFSFQW